MGGFGREGTGAGEASDEVGVGLEEGELEVVAGFFDDGVKAREEGRGRVKRAGRPGALGDPWRMLEDWPEDCCEFRLSEGVNFLQVHSEVATDVQRGGMEAGLQGNALDAEGAFGA